MTPRDEFRVLRGYMRELYEDRNRRRDRRKMERRQQDAGMGGVPGLDRRKWFRRSGRDRRRSTK